VLEFISKFYNADYKNASSSRHNDLAQNQRSDLPKVDRAFQEQVWRWLTKHPDVHVGRDRRGNKMSLSTVEAPYLTKRPVCFPENTEDMPSSSTLLDHNSQQHPPTLSTPLSQSAKEGGAMRIYATEERMWLAICGHSKDLTKVFETEFVLLSIIATYREGGILQTNLVKKSGQDKRSVPKRTDMLRNKGYIEKRAVCVRGMKTSLLVLRRFASNGVSNLVTPESASLESHSNVRDESVDIYALVRSLFAILKQKTIVTCHDLNKELGMVTRWQVRMLRKIVEKFEVIGCVKRVKAASEASKKVRYYFDCLKLIHEPSDQEMKAFETTGKSIVVEHAVEQPDLENEDDPSEAMVGSTSGIVGNQLQEIGRVVPQWNPDRLLANSLLNAIHWAGIHGFTNRVRGATHHGNHGY
jgi:B-block binding subunit of TFIIIC